MLKTEDVLARAQAILDEVGWGGEIRSRQIKSLAQALVEYTNHYLVALKEEVTELKREAYRAN